MTRSPSANVRRLAASAIGKLAGLIEAADAVAGLHPMLQDSHPQVRQYAAKALTGYGAAAECALADLRDMAISPVEKEYNNACAKRAIELIEEANRIEEKRAEHCCQRCGVKLEPDEYARSHKSLSAAILQLLL